MSSDKYLMKVAKCIRRHGFRATIWYGTVYAQTSYTVGDDPALKWKWERVGKDLESAKKWLGY